MTEEEFNKEYSILKLKNIVPSFVLSVIIIICAEIFFNFKIAWYLDLLFYIVLLFIYSFLRYYLFCIKERKKIISLGADVLKKGLPREDGTWADGSVIKEEINKEIEKMLSRIKILETNLYSGGELNLLCIQGLPKIQKIETEEFNFINAYHLEEKEYNTFKIFIERLPKNLKKCLSITIDNKEIKLTENDDSIHFYKYMMIKFKNEIRFNFKKQKLFFKKLNRLHIKLAKVL